MKRNKPPTKIKPDLILTSDWHLRSDTPICRTDDFFQAQWRKIAEIYKLQEKFDCPIIHAGDLFNHWKPSPYLLSQSILFLPKQFHTVYGQHDLPQHNLELAYKCGIDTLNAACALHLLSGTHFGEKEPQPYIYERREEAKILIWHKLVWSGLGDVPHWSGDSTAEKLLKKYPEYDLIVTGDNHKSFVVEHKGRLLVNPGALTRQKADEANHKPCVYLWYAKTNTAEPFYLEIEEGVISREHIERKEERDHRIEAFVSRLNDDWETTVSFEHNLDQFLSKNNIRKPVEEIIRRAIE